MNVTDWISAIADVTTAIAAIIVLLYFNRHTQKTEQHTMDTEELERHHLNVDGQRMFLDEFRSQTAMVYEVMDQIYEKDMSAIVDKLRNTNPKNISLEEKEKLESVIFRANNAVQLVENQLIDKNEWRGFFKDNNLELNNALDIELNLNSQLNILKKFVIDIDFYLVNVDDEVFSNIKGISNDEIYLDFKDNLERKVNTKDDTNQEDSQKITDDVKDPEGKSTVLMVALHKSDDNNSWLQQSLGSWKISQERAQTVDYIAGIDIETRNLVSLVSVKSPKTVGENRVRFEVEEKGIKQEQPYDVETKNLSLDDATYWNARNPVKYIYKTKDEINELKNQL